MPSSLTINAALCEQTSPYFYKVYLRFLADTLDGGGCTSASDVLRFLWSSSCYSRVQILKFPVYIHRITCTMHSYVSWGD